MSDKKALTEPLPHFVVMALPFDPWERTAALLFRGDNVRSAKNCLSAPSGLLEHSEEFAKGLARELEEEIGLNPLEHRWTQFHRIYRSINGDGFDWVIGVWSVAVEGLASKLKNLEPDKHDAVIMMPLDSFDSIDEFRRQFTQGKVQYIEPSKPVEKPLNFSPDLFPVLKGVVEEIQKFLK